MLKSLSKVTCDITFLLNQSVLSYCASTVSHIIHVHVLGVLATPQLPASSGGSSYRHPVEHLSTAVLRRQTALQTAGTEAMGRRESQKISCSTNTVLGRWTCPLDMGFTSNHVYLHFHQVSLGQKYIIYKHMATSGKCKYNIH